MRNGKVGPLEYDDGEQAQRTPTGSDYFEDASLAPVAPYYLAGEMVKLQEFTDLVGIPGREDDFIPFLLELFDNWQEKRDVRRIIQIDPDFFRCSNRSGSAFAMNGHLRTRLLGSNFEVLRHILLLDDQGHWFASRPSEGLQQRIESGMLTRKTTEPT
jgi:hypothetical protein